MSGAQPSTEPARAKKSVERAITGQLASGGKHKVSYNGSYRSVLPQMFFDNVQAGPGDKGTMYMDFQNECIVISYGEVE